ncbi:hypothetical protein [Haloplanus litoreus]|uniref:Uncharacterized protein n=1 Tax=Haloplanus litoreus TaxID=767515 RepID=A0ABD6A3P3_9EURY
MATTELTTVITTNAPVRRQRPRSGGEFFAGDPVAVLLTLLVALHEVVEPARDDRLGVQDDRVCFPVQPRVVEAFEDGFDRRLWEREGDRRGVLAVTGLVGDDVVDPFVVEGSQDGVALPRRDHDLNESHGRISTPRRHIACRRSQSALVGSPASGVVPSRHVK